MSGSKSAHPEPDRTETSRRAVPATVLVTGATGRLGTATCAALVARGFAVRATDLRFRPGVGVRVEVGDLLDEAFVYRVLEGIDAVVHLGNHPNAFAGPSPQQLLADNVRMNANVFYAATDLGVRTLVFASSVQVFLRILSHHKQTPPYPIPYFPLDGRAPRAPGLNPYGLSKELGERLLEELARQHPELSAIALRFPMLPNEHWLGYVREGTMPPWGLNYQDALTYLDLRDAGSLIAALVDAQLRGYRQYFPALQFRVRGLSVADIIRRNYPEAELRRPLAELDSLVDLSELTQAVSWRPEHAVTAEIG